MSLINTGATKLLLPIFLVLVQFNLALSSPDLIWPSGDGPQYDVPLKTNFKAFNMKGMYKYVGCYDTGPYFSELPHILLRAKLSSARCYMYCMDRGYLYFGMRGHYCSCGNTYGTVGSKPETSCNQACDLDPTEKCGGRRALSVYTVIAKYNSVGCFNVSLDNDVNWHRRSTYSTKMECALICQKEFAPYFAMQLARMCYCGTKISYFTTHLPDVQCLGPCLEMDIVRCGKNGFSTSVYNIEYANGKVEVLQSFVGFLSGKRQMLLTVKSASLFGLVIDSRSRLYIRVQAQSDAGSQSYSELIGDTPKVKVAPCPAGWLTYYLNGSLTNERYIRPGYRCYLPAKAGKSWKDAMRQCWEHHSDLFYLEDQSEFDFLSDSNIDRGKYWIGMYYIASLNTFMWLRETNTMENGTARRVVNTTSNGCIQLTPKSKIWMADACTERNMYLCKRFSSLYAGWDFRLHNSIKHGRNVSMTLMETQTNATLLNVKVNVEFGSHTVEIPSHPGSRLHYSVTENVPLKTCKEHPYNEPAFYFTCTEPGGVLPRSQFGKRTCVDVERTTHGGEWTEPLSSWTENVGYHVTEVHIFKQPNASFTVQSDSREPCQQLESTDSEWAKFVCNKNVKGLILSTTGTKYYYAYMCDLLVFGYQAWDNSRSKLDNQYKDSDRILDIKVLGIFSRPRSGGLILEEKPLADDFYVQIFQGSKLLSLVHHRQSDFFSVVVKKEDNFLAFYKVRDHSSGDLHSSRRCSEEILIGNISCRFSDNTFLYLNVRERVNLHGCSQSTTRFPIYYCENAYNLVHVGSHRYGKCAETYKTKRPWWKAKVSTTYVFEEIVLHTTAERNEWTKNFNVSIEISACIVVRNGTAFVKKSFRCNFMGTEIMVQALSNSVTLSICELIAYGRPGGCGEIQLPSPDRSSLCKGRLHSHLSFGSVPYERGMRCMWLIGAGPNQTPFITFPKFRTASSKDYVLVYEGAGTGGKLLARFYGNGENKPKYPWLTVTGLTNYVRGKKWALTLVFVTDRHPPPEVDRSMVTHLGFTAEIYLSDNDNLLMHHITPTPICEKQKFMQQLRDICEERGGINPMFEHGPEMGADMIRYRNESLIRSQQRQRQNGITMRYKRQGIPIRVQQTFYCSSEEVKNSLPYVLKVCCCETCWIWLLKKLCIHPISTSPASSCNLRVRRALLKLKSD